MEYIIKYTDEAINDLFVIYNYIAYYAKELLNAKKLIKDIKSSINKLRYFPYRNSELPSYLSHGKNIRYITVKGYLVLYLIDDESMIVNVLRFFSSKRDITKLKLLK